VFRSWRHILLLLVESAIASWAGQAVAFAAAHSALAVHAVPQTPGAKLQIIDNGETGIRIMGAWTPALMASGDYLVWAWRAAGVGGASNAPFTVHHAQGSTTRTVDQSSGSGGWILLGTFSLAPSANHRVVVSDAAPP